MRLYWLICLCVTFSPTIAPAQLRSGQTTDPSVEQDGEPLPPIQQQTPLNSSYPGRTARSSVGQVGQRQTRDTTAAETGIEPMGRVANRIQNRIQNRIRNRIDRNYDTQVGMNDPFTVAEEQTRARGRPR